MALDQMYKARELVNASFETIEALPVKFSVIFEDEEIVQVYRAETIYTWFFWEMLRQYPETTIRKTHHISHALGGRMLNSGTHLKLCSSIFESIVKDCRLNDPRQREKLLKLINKTISDASKEGSKLSSRNVMALDILDFVQVAHYPPIAKLREDAIKNPKKIQKVYEDCLKILESDSYFDRNGLALAVRAKMVKLNQVVQCVLFRGFVSEVDGVMFPSPVWSNYLFGMRRIKDFASDSRTAAKSHFYSDSVLKRSEYTARKFRLFAMTVESLGEDDCGTTNHLEWLVQGEVKDAGGATKYPGDLPMMVGKHYLTESGEYDVIKGNETHLVGKVIQVRSPLYCRSHNPRQICKKCVGELAVNISRFANIGHLASVTVSSPLSQSILSIKHVNTSSSAITVALTTEAARYFTPSADGTGYCIRPDVDRSKVQIRISRDDVFGLTEPGQIRTLSQISLARVSSVSEIHVVKDANRPGDFAVIPTKTRGKDSLISREFLSYLQTAGWTITDTGYYQFDLSKWDPRQPILVTENREESFSDLASRVESLILSFPVDKKGLAVNEADRLLQEVFSIVNTKLWINIAAFEIVIYALMVAGRGDYSMARGSANPSVGQADALTKARSLGGALAYEDMHITLTSPLSFYSGHRPDSALDVFLAPEEVVRHYHPEAYDYREEAL